MAATVKLPKFGLTMEEATINEWLIGVGEPVEQGQTLATIDSEKVTMELPSPVGGVVAEYLAQVGDTVPVGSPLAVIVAAEEFEDYASKEA
jgi:pyruvate/2-oxoglutarate dehydrogenase complex dihydrolipoamide acyltransferase (E2) component